MFKWGVQIQHGVEVWTKYGRFVIDMVRNYQSTVGYIGVHLMHQIDNCCGLRMGSVETFRKMYFEVLRTKLKKCTTKRGEKCIKL